jgi:ABC-type branched-subunit amino acid transport system ATPase component/ABC-type branched-subunit amino acid transport system permease subunit
MTARLGLGPTTLALCAFAALVILYPLVFSSSYGIGVGITAGAMAAGSVGFVLLLGYAHQLALGQAGFCMIGGYASAILCTRYRWDPTLAMLVGAVLSMAVAWVVAVPILKLRGFVLAMGSLALHLILIVFAFELTGLTGGALGTYGVQRFAVFGTTLTTDLAYYFLVWAIVLLFVGMGLNIDRSCVGRALKAIAVSEMAAGSVGIDIVKHKVQMFVVAAGMASVSGSLFVHFLRAMDPTVFGFAFSLNLITAVIIGGLMSIWGAAIGATVVTGLREGLRGFSLPMWESVIMGALTALVLIVFPRGIAGFIGKGYARLMGAAGSVRPSIIEAGAAALPPCTDRPATGEPMLQVTGVSRSFGSLKAVSDVSFTAATGAITALIGPNGAGKTTLFNLIGGYQPVDSGSVTFRGKPIERLLPNEIAVLGVGRTFQNLQLFDNMTVLDNVMSGRHRFHSAGIVPVSVHAPRVRRDEEAARRTALEALSFVGLHDAESLLPTELSFGHQRLVEIARALALQPTLLLMDEPASGLNDTETEQLARLIVRISLGGITVLLVEHDMRLVMGLADTVVVMHHGQKIADGPPDRVRADREVIAAYLGTEVDERVA